MEILLKSAYSSKSLVTSTSKGTCVKMNSSTIKTSIKNMLSKMYLIALISRRVSLLQCTKYKIIIFLIAWVLKLNKKPHSLIYKTKHGDATFILLAPVRKKT